MAVYKRGPVFWVRFKRKGQEYRCTTSTDDKRAAKAFERRYRDQVESAANLERSAAPPLSQLATADIRRALSRSLQPGAQLESTLATYWRRVTEALGDVTADKVTAASFESVIEHCRKRKMRSQSIRRVLAALARGIRLAGLTVPPVPNLSADAPRASQAGRLIPLADLRRWLAALESGYQDLALFALLTGLRAAELSRVTAAMLVTAPPGSNCPATLNLPAEVTKTRRPRTVGLTGEALAVAAKRATTVGPTAPLFTLAGHRRAFARAAKLAGLTITPHLRDTRHAYASLSLAGTGDLRATMEALGHSTLAAAGRYQHADEARTMAASVAVTTALAGGLKRRAVPAWCSTRVLDFSVHFETCRCMTLALKTFFGGHYKSRAQKG